MNKLQAPHARIWHLSSSIFLSLAITAATWIVSVILFFMIDWSDLVNWQDETSVWLASVLTFIVLCYSLCKSWKSVGSAKLYTAELIIGSVLILGGASFAVYGYILNENHVPTGMLSGLEFILMILIGIYVACTGVLATFAGILGWISNPRMRGHKKA